MRSAVVRIIANSIKSYVFKKSRSKKLEFLRVYRKKHYKRSKIKFNIKYKNYSVYNNPVILTSDKTKTNKLLPYFSLNLYNYNSRYEKLFYFDDFYENFLYYKFFNVHTFKNTINKNITGIIALTYLTWVYIYKTPEFLEHSNTANVNKISNLSKNKKNFIDVFARTPDVADLADLADLADFSTVINDNTHNNLNNLNNIKLLNSINTGFIKKSTNSDDSCFILHNCS